MSIIKNVLAADVKISDLPNPAPKIPVDSKISDLLSLGHFNLLDFVFFIIGLLFFANLIMAGWDYMLSSGDSKKVSSATTRLVNGIVGLIITIAAFLVVRLVTRLLGLNNLI